MSETIYRGPGIYIVTLTNEHLISVNADRPAISERCIKVNRQHCKFGKALNLQVRRGNYIKTFGAEHVRFHAIAAVAQPKLVESLVASTLLPHRLRGATGRLNEWLFGLSPLEVEAVVLEALVRSGLPYSILGQVSLSELAA